MSMFGVNSAVTAPQLLKNQEPSAPRTEAPKTASANESAVAENAAQKAARLQPNGRRARAEMVEVSTNWLDSVALPMAE
jgi:hypothetical protein